MQKIRLLIYCLLIGVNSACSTDTIREAKNGNEMLSEIKSDTIKVILEQIKQETTEASDNAYCFIKDIIIKDSTTYLQVDFIQFFQFDEAVEEAKKRGDAEFEINEGGDTTYFVYNDYYIANDNPKLRIFEIAATTEFEFLEIFGDTVPNFEDTASTMKRVNFSPFIIQTENGKIKRLEEVYIP